MRAAIYARVSGHEQVKGTSLGTQVDEAKAYIEHQGWELVGEFVDAGVSGKLASRPQLDEMMRAVKSKRVDVIVVKSMDRLGRTSRDLHVLMGEIETDSDCKLVFLRERLDSTTPAGKLMRDLLMSVASFEHESILERTSSGRRAAAKTGVWTPGRIGFGLARSETGFVLDKVAVETIERIFDLFVTEFLSSWKIAEVLNAEGRPSPSGGRWKPAALRSWLRAARHLNGSMSFKLDGETFTVAVPEILSAERHDALQTAIASRKGQTRKQVVDFPLSGRIISECGTPMHGLSRNDRGPDRCRSYRCRQDHSREANATRCSCSWASARVVEELVWEAVRSLLSDPERVAALVETELAQLGDRERAGLGESASALAAKIARLEASAGESIADLIRARVGSTIVQDTAKRIEADLAAMRQLHATALAWERVASEKGSLVDGASQILETLESNLEAPTPGTLRRVAEALDLRVTVSRHVRCEECNRGWLARPRRQCPECSGRGSIPSLTVTGLLPLAPATSTGDTAAGGVSWTVAV